MQKLLVMDVDGTLTDGGIYYDGNGNEFKKFNAKDGAGIRMANKAGIQTMILTGRECVATTRRMEELGVKHLVQNVEDKKAFLSEFINENSFDTNDVVYIGDDLNDYWAMQLAGHKACPVDAGQDIKEIVDYISPYRGGSGAVRDVIERLLRKEGIWNKLI